MAGRRTDRYRACVIWTSLLVAVLVMGIAALLGAVSALRPRVGLFVERSGGRADVAPDRTRDPADSPVVAGSRLAVITVAVLMGVPYAVRFTAGAAAPVAATGHVEAAAAGGERPWHLVVLHRPSRSLRLPHGPAHRKPWARQQLSQR
ncbi:hypothetical protein [Actinophytocola sp.]|uniref:hypothetical protein n=1 Tax=Actinophytocola sp. TaxID=1872138 RepID=UPI002ED39068